MTNADKQEPVAWRHTLHMELGQTHTRLSEDSQNPFGKPGRDYSAEFTVTSEPLYTRPTSDLAERIEGLVEALEELSAKATPGPYRIADQGRAVAAKRGKGVILRAVEQFMSRSEREANAELAATLMANLPVILAALKEVNNG